MFFSFSKFVFFFSKQKHNMESENLGRSRFNRNDESFVKPPLLCSSSFLGYSSNSGIIFTC